jgi:hypothetical protein
MQIIFLPFGAQTANDDAFNKPQENRDKIADFA